MRLAAALAALLPLGSPRPAAASHEDLGFGARAAAMGEAFTAVTDDGAAMAYNPAAFGWLRRGEVQASYRRLFQIPAGQADHDLMGGVAAASLKGAGLPGAVGLQWSHAGVRDLSIDRSVGLAWASRAWKEFESGHLELGAALKSLSRSGRAPGGSVSKAGVDVGFLYRLGEERAFGLSLLNVNGPRTDLPGIADRAPVVARLGYAQTLRGFTAALDFVRREPSFGRRATSSGGLGMEYWFHTPRWGSFAGRSGLNLGDQAKSWRFGAGWRALGAQVDYAFIAPLAGGSRWGSAVSLSVRFGAWDTEAEYEKLLGSEIRYRRDLTRALESAEVRQWKLGEEQRRLRKDIEQLKADLAEKTEDEASAKEKLKAAQRRLAELEERERRSEQSLQEAEQAGRTAAQKSKSAAFREDWLAYQKAKMQGAPDLVLQERVQQILREYKDSGVDLSEANQELLRLLRSRPVP